MSDEVIVPGRFNGPPASGNGGYSCGVVARHIDGAARVRLHVPPPLDLPMRVSRADDGSVEIFDGATLVGSGSAIEYQLQIPPAPGLAAAKDAMSRFVARDEHLFETCFVCGPKRLENDGLELFPGPVSDWNLLACVWQPRPDMADSNGNVLPEIVWSALDCPGYFAAVGDTLLPAVLGQLEGELTAPVPADQALVVYCWPMGSEGRKHYAGTAIADASGSVLASSRSTWIELKNRN